MLQKALIPVKDDYDYIIDCAPSLGLLIVNS